MPARYHLYPDYCPTLWQRHVTCFADWPVLGPAALGRLRGKQGCLLPVAHDEFELVPSVNQIKVVVGNREHFCAGHKAFEHPGELRPGLRGAAALVQLGETVLGLVFAGSLARRR